MSWMMAQSTIFPFQITLMGMKMTVLMLYHLNGSRTVHDFSDENLPITMIAFTVCAVSRGRL